MFIEENNPHHLPTLNHTESHQWHLQHQQYQYLSSQIIQVGKEGDVGERERERGRDSKRSRERERERERERQDLS